MGREATESASMLSSICGRMAPPPRTNSKVVSVSTTAPSEVPKELRTISDFFLTTLSCVWKCLMMAEGSWIEVVVVM